MLFRLRSHVYYMFASGRPAIVMICVLLFASGCEEAEFQGSGGGSAKTPTSAQGLPDTGCSQGDFSNMKFPPDIQKCLDEGKLYHFDTGSCTDILRATFACNFDTILAELNQRKFPTNEIEVAKQNNGSLIGCGQASDNSTIVVQWLEATKDEQNDCQFKEGTTNIVTGCYRKYSGQVPATPTSDDEHRQFVRECMSDNQR